MVEEETSIKEMRNALIYFTIREFPRLSPHQIYKDIKGYEKMPVDKLRMFYKGWFQTEIKERNK